MPLHYQNYSHNPIVLLCLIFNTCTYKLQKDKGFCSWLPLFVLQKGTSQDNALNQGMDLNAKLQCSLLAWSTIQFLLRLFGNCTALNKNVQVVCAPLAVGALQKNFVLKGLKTSAWIRYQNDLLSGQESMCKWSAWCRSSWPLWVSYFGSKLVIKFVIIISIY